MKLYGFLLKYCIYCVSVPSLRRESTDSLLNEVIVVHTNFHLMHSNISVNTYCLPAFQCLQYKRGSGKFDHVRDTSGRRMSQKLLIVIVCGHARAQNSTKS